MATDQSNAAQYADSLANAIQEMADAGSPFGWINENTGEWLDYDPTTKPEFHADADEYEEASAGDYLRDVLDIEYLVTSDRQYKAARLLIAFGGPNAWIDTRTSRLEVAWWSAPEYRDLPSAFIDGLDEYLSEYWEMGA